MFIALSLHVTSTCTCSSLLTLGHPSQTLDLPGPLIAIHLVTELESRGLAFDWNLMENLTRMHSSRMCTTHSLPQVGVSVRGGSLVQGVSVQGGLCPGGSLETCENITLPQTSFAGGKYLSSNAMTHCSA